jgi:regulator of cell morphogenesis and NO signaling
MHGTVETNLQNRTIGEVVAEDYARAAVFKRLGIDFCCGGSRTVGAACEQAGVRIEDLAEGLARGDRRTGGWPDPRGWDPVFLANYIVEVHHRYVRETLPVLVQFAHKVARVHGGNRAELHRIRDLVEELATEMAAHMAEEEDTVFPRITALSAARKAGTTTDGPGLQDLVAALEHDHDHAGDLMRRIRALSDGYSPPAMACATYRATYAKLSEFEDDLHRHVHLENNVLFPQVLSL